MVVTKKYMYILTDNIQYIIYRFSLRWLVTGYPRASLTASFYIYKVPPTKTRAAFCFLPQGASVTNNGSLCRHLEPLSEIWWLYHQKHQVPAANLRSSAGDSCLREQTRRVTGCGREKEGRSRAWGCLNPQLWLRGSSLLEDEKTKRARHSFTYTLFTVLGGSLPVSSTSRVSVLGARLSFSRVIVCRKANYKNLKLWIHVSFPSWEVAKALPVLRHP